MASIQYDPEGMIYSKLGSDKSKYPVMVEPSTKLRPLSVEFDLKVIFRPQEVWANFRSDKYFIAIRNASILVTAEKGRCLDFTKQAYYEVDYSIETSKSKQSEEKDNVDANFTYSPVSVNVGEGFSSSEIEERKTIGRLKKNEKQLSVKSVSGEVEWHYALPNIDSVASDLLDEVLDLKVEFEWNQAPMQGLIQLRPGKIEFFDSERKRYPKFKNVGYFIVLFHKHLLMNNMNININYEVY